MNKKPESDALVLAIPESLPELLYHEFQGELAVHDIPLRVQKTPTQIYASLEWAVPTLVAVYLVKPFLETLLKQAAEDAYPTIKVAFKRLFRPLFGSERESRHRQISPLLALYFESREGYVVKALMWEGIPEEVENEVVNQLFALIKRQYNSGASIHDTLLVTREELPVQWGRLFLRFNLDKRVWEAVDIMQVARQQRLDRGLTQPNALK